MLSNLNTGQLALVSLKRQPSNLRKLKTTMTPSTLPEVSKRTSVLNENKSNSVTVKSALRFNKLNIQMLPTSLHRKIFKNDIDIPDLGKVEASIKHLKQHGLWGKETDILEDVDINLPPLLGENIADHFRLLAERQTAEYSKIAKQLANCKLPPKPTHWNFESGWTRYDSNGDWGAVEFPDEDGLIFDVEVLVRDGQKPTLATAVSTKAWFSWCSKRLVDDKFAFSEINSLEELIRLESRFIGSKRESNVLHSASDGARLVVGHNVSYDRARIRDQYAIQGSRMRFIDTMALHMAVSGLTAYQRILKVAYAEGSRRKEVKEAEQHQKLSRSPLNKAWTKVGSANSLSEVHKLYCKGAALSKEDRNVFVKGTIDQVRCEFQTLMEYCANDVTATHRVFHKLFPLFSERFPNPVTFAGMLELSVAFLPINDNWQRYLTEAEDTYQDLQMELNRNYMHLANQTCALIHQQKYKGDVWMWNLDWSIQDMRIKKTPKPSARKQLNNKTRTEPETALNDMSAMAAYYQPDPGPPNIDMGSVDEAIETTTDNVKRLLATVDRLFKVRTHLPGYPAWYRDLCVKDSVNKRKKAELQLRDADDWTPGPSLISSNMQVTPKLLRLTWDGHPLHFDDKYGWGYVKPNNQPNLDQQLADNAVQFPYWQLDNSNKFTSDDQTGRPSFVADSLWQQLKSGLLTTDQELEAWSQLAETQENDNSLRGKSKKRSGNKGLHPASASQCPLGPFPDVNISGGLFFKLPHQNGPDNRVGNPLAKEFLNKIEDGTLRSVSGNPALKISKMMSYWKNAKKRINSQMAVLFKSDQLPSTVTSDEDFNRTDNFGAILPQLVTAGTVTRRAVEPTWLTASNAYTDRVGSELKAMVQCPPGYNFVGADVDSQELWIAALLGDAHFAGLHGSTAFGWMTLQGKKSQGTDMHSKTASAVGISRDHAKVLNYGRIYGAGQPFATRLLMQFNHRLSEEEAKQKAIQMYAMTKGQRRFSLTEDGLLCFRRVFEAEGLDCRDLDCHRTFTRAEINHVVKKTNAQLCFDHLVGRKVWHGGTESHMFNKLEEIAQSLEPRTPVLNARISRTLEPAYVGDDFMTSRVNWAVQSSAVDYLHLMLVCMRWLCDDIYKLSDARFAISIHDEVRYMVRKRDRYVLALALQVSNLLTRSVFAYQVGMDDLPRSVAFFSTVDVDTVLRKEVDADCKTPSNPRGLTKGYGIPRGEALDIFELLEKLKKQE